MQASTYGRWYLIKFILKFRELYSRSSSFLFHFLMTLLTEEVMTATKVKRRSLQLHCRMFLKKNLNSLCYLELYIIYYKQHKARYTLMAMILLLKILPNVERLLGSTFGELTTLFRSPKKINSVNFGVY